MARYSTPPMSEKQGKFIQSLIDQLGYKDSPHKEFFLNRVYLSTATIEYASNLIGKLLEENRKRKFTRRSTRPRAFSTVQDLSQFSFCPASYSVKETFVIEQSKVPEDEQDEIDEAPESYLLDLISCIGKMSIIERQEYLSDLEEIDTFVESKLVYNGYSIDKSLFNVAHDISGKPHLIFETSSGKRILIVEKITFNIPDSAWHNHIIQTLAYVNFFPRLKISKAFVIYWERGNITSTLWRKFKVFEIENTEKNKNKLFSTISLFSKLNAKEIIPFDTEAINPEKCYKCNCRAICNHKSGLITNLIFPYSTEEYYKKYR